MSPVNAVLTEDTEENQEGITDWNLVLCEVVHVWWEENPAYFPRIHPQNEFLRG